MIEGIILAAGRSSRAGVFKPAHLHRGQSLLLHAVDSLAPWCDRVVVVAGHRHDEVRDLIPPLRAVRLVINRDHGQGMFSSVRAGLEALADDVCGVFVMPIDCPWLDPTVATTLIAAFDRHDRARAVVPEFEGRGGHPVLLPAASRAMAARAASGATLRDVVRDLDPVRVPVEHASVLRDLDTPDDFQALAVAEGD